MITLSEGLNVIVWVVSFLMYAWSRMALRVVGSVNVGMRLNWTLVFWFCLFVWMMVLYCVSRSFGVHEMLES